MHYQSEVMGGCVVPPEVGTVREDVPGDTTQKAKDRRKGYKRAFYAAVREFEARKLDPGPDNANLQKYAHERALERYARKVEVIEDAAEREARRIAGEAEKLKEACWKRQKGRAAVGREALKWADRWEKLCEAWSNHATDELAALHANVEEAVLKFALEHSDDMATERRRRMASLTITALNKLGVAVTRGEKWAIEKHLEKALPEEYGSKDGGALMKGAKIGFSLANLTRQAAAINAAPRSQQDVIEGEVIEKGSGV